MGLELVMVGWVVDDLTISLVILFISIREAFKKKKTKKDKFF